MLDLQEEFDIVPCGSVHRVLGLDEPPGRLCVPCMRVLFPHLWEDKNYEIQRSKSLDVGRTICDLQQRGRRQIDRYRRWSGLSTIGDEDIDPEDLVRAVFALREGLTDSAWRTERSAAASVIVPLPHENRDRSLARLQADSKRRRYKPNHPVFFAEDDFRQLQVQIPFLCREGMEKWLSDIVVTIISSGVEPEELGATFIEKRYDESGARRVWLKVVMAAFADDVYYRTIEISGLPGDVISAIERTIDLCGTWVLKKKFDCQLRKCSRAFVSVCRRNLR